MLNRREYLKGMAAVAAGIGLGSTLAGRGLLHAAPAAAAPAPAPAGGPFKLPPLGYAYDALEPHIDAVTMKIHHTAHHQAYVNNVNGVVPKWDGLTRMRAEEILAKLSDVPEPVRMTVRNNLGGHWNHTFFWELMTPGGAKAPAGALKTAIDTAFGSLQGMTDKVNDAGLKRFGSGWAWLAVGKDKKLTVISTANQDTPHMEGHLGAVLGVDVWEHAYYLKHQNKRAEYLKTWWNTVNWDKAGANFAMLTK
jgi:Fe-Mn family superoxide dismutase